MALTKKKTDGVVLRQTNYRDADRILTLFTREYGQMSVIARGARRSRRRFGGSLEPFCHLEFEFGRGSANRSLTTLTNASVQRSFPNLMTSYGRLKGAGLATTLVRELAVDESPDPPLLDALLMLFRELGPQSPNETALLLSFEIRALALSGFQPSLDECVVTGTRRPEGQAAYFDPIRGGIVRRDALGGSAALPLSSSALSRMKASHGPEWTHVHAWSDGNVLQARQVIDAFRASHVKSPEPQKVR